MTHTAHHVERNAPQPHTHPTSDAPLALALMSGAAGTVHLAQIPPHLSESHALSALFLAAGLFQCAWALQAAPRLSLPHPHLAVAANTAIALAWLLSRTAGLPLGPDAGTPEPAGALDILTTLDEAALIAGILLITRKSTSPRQLRGATYTGAAIAALLTCLLISGIDSHT